MLDECGDVASHQARVDRPVDVGCPAVALQVGEDDLVACGERLQRRPEHLAGPEPAVEQDDRAAGAVSLEVEVDPVEVGVFAGAAGSGGQIGRGHRADPPLRQRSGYPSPELGGFRMSERHGTIIELDDLEHSRSSHEFVGAEHGDVPFSIILVHAGPGVGPKLHRHPYRRGLRRRGGPGVVPDRRCDGRRRGGPRRRQSAGRGPRLRQQRDGRAAADRHPRSVALRHRMARRPGSRLDLEAGSRL